MSYGQFHLGQQLVTRSHTHVHIHIQGEKVQIAQFSITQSLVIPCSSAATLLNSNNFGSSVQTQRDTDLPIPLDEHKLGFEGKLRSECNTENVYMHVKPVLVWLCASFLPVNCPLNCSAFLTPHVSMHQTFSL